MLRAPGAVAPRGCERLELHVPLMSTTATVACTTTTRQVLKEVRPLYKVVCEGIINLADKFFEMERGDALKGLEVYKENILMNEKLNAFFATIQNISALRGAVQFPNVQVRAGFRRGACVRSPQPM